MRTYSWGKNYRRRGKEATDESSQLHTLELWITLTAVPINHHNVSLTGKMAGVNLILILYEFSVNELLGKWHLVGYTASTTASLSPSVLWRYKPPWLSELIKLLNLDSRGHLYLSWSSLSPKDISLQPFHLASCFSWCYHSFASGSCRCWLHWHVCCDIVI